MALLLKSIFWFGLSFLVIVWLYVAARMITRGIVRSLNERKEKENGKKDKA